MTDLARLTTGRFTLLPTLFSVLLLAILATGAALTLVPSRIDQGPDAVAYAYVGQIILDGGIPYRDARDSKPPLTFYLSALALALGGVTLWSLWGLRIITVIVTALLFGGLLHDLRLRRWMVRAGMLGFVLVITRPVWADTSTPELYALPFQIVCLRAGYRLLRALAGQHAPARRGVLSYAPTDAAWAMLTGMLGGMILLGKQTSGGVVITLVGLLVVWGFAARRQGDSAQTRRIARAVLLIGVGALTPLGLTALYLAAHGALADAYDAAIMYNRYYSQVPFAPVAIVRSALTRNAAVTTVYLTLSMFALMGALSAAREPNPLQRALVRWLAVSSLLDFFVVNAAANGFGHYFLTPLPAFLALVLLGVEFLLTREWRSPALRIIARLGAVYVFVLVMALPNALDLTLIMVASHGNPFRQTIDTTVIDYIERYTGPDDTVLVWGYQPVLNLLSGRRSPSRYFYSHPLTLYGYSDAGRITAFIDELHASQPALIVDVSIDMVPDQEKKVPPIDTRKMALFYRLGGRHKLADVTLFREFVNDHCTIERQMLLQANEAIIYRCTYDG